MFRKGTCNSWWLGWTIYRHSIYSQYDLRRVWTGPTGKHMFMPIKCMSSIYNHRTIFCKYDRWYKKGIDRTCNFVSIKDHPCYTKETIDNFHRIRRNWRKFSSWRARLGETEKVLLAINFNWNIWLSVFLLVFTQGVSVTPMSLLRPIGDSPDRSYPTVSGVFAHVMSRMSPSPNTHGLQWHHICRVYNLEVQALNS